MPYSPGKTTSRIIKSGIKSFILILFLILLPLSTLKAQEGYLKINLTFKTANYSESDSLLIQIQVSSNRDFTNIVNQSDWLKCQPNKYFTYEASIPLIHGSFYWRGRHQDPSGGQLSGWSSPYRFYLLLDPDQFIPGDVNADLELNISDVIYIINYFLKRGPAPTPLEAGDTNCSGEVTISDLIYLINYLFQDGPDLGC